MKYRKKPIEVEAIQLFQSDFDHAFAEKKKNTPSISSFIWKFNGKEIRLTKTRERKIQASVRTLKGEMILSNGDWFIKEINNESYFCKPDIFHKTYEPIKSL